MTTSRYGMGFVSAALLLVCLVTGCPSNIPGDVDTYEEVVYFVGDMTGVLEEEIDQIFVNLLPYDGVSADAPVFVAASEVATMSDTTKAGLNLTFEAHLPIFGVHMGENEINALLGVLGLEQNYTLPDGKPHAELFAVDREEDGHLFTWSMYPPDEGAAESEDEDAPVAPTYSDNEAEQLERTGLLSAWLEEDENRVTPEIKQMRSDAAAALASAAKADGGELTQVAQGFVTTRNFTNNGNNYQLSYYIYSCHSFNAVDSTGYDWFYVRQEGMLNASGGYGGVKDWYGGGPSDECHYYIGNYKTNNWMESLGYQDSGVAIMAANPQNANNVAQVTSGVDWNIGGSVGFQGTDFTAALTGGVTIHNSTTVNVSDCEVTNSSADNVNNARWAYTFTKCHQTAYFGYTGLAAPPVLSRSNFQPVNQWIWKFAPSVRDANKTSFISSFDVDLIWSVGGQSYGWWIAKGPNHHTYKGGNWSFTVPLTFPPLMVVPHNIDFSAVGQYKALDIAVSRNWVASSDQSWCHVEPVSGTAANTHVNITVDPNSTGASRTATVSFATADGRGIDKMIVFQSQY